MELTFSTNKFQYLKKIYYCVKHQEETGEMIVPDSYPDAAAICDSFASVYLRGKECRSGGAVLSGAIKGGVLYAPDDGSHPRLLEYYIPFSMKFDSVELSEDAQLMATMKICSVDARMINSRKIVLRTNVGGQVTVYRTVSDDCYKLQDPDTRLQCKCSDVTFRLPVELGEKYLVVNDVMEIPGDQPPVVQICKVTCEPVLTDRKLIGDKAVFKGDLRCRVMYRSENDKIYTWKQNLPFSQYCELQREYDEDEVMITPVLCSCDTVVDGEAPIRRIQITADVSAQCIVYSDFAMTFTEDAYCVRGELFPQWAEYALEGRLDRTETVMTYQQTISGTVQEVIDMEIYDDYPVWKCGDGTSEANIPMTVKVCAYGSDGALISLSNRSEMKKSYSSADNAVCSMYLSPVEVATASCTASGVDVRCNYRADTVFEAVHRMTTLCGGSVEDRTNTGEREPSVILKQTESGQPLWEIGKKYSTSVASLQSANHLDSETAPGGMLLIPID